MAKITKIILFNLILLTATMRLLGDKLYPNATFYEGYHEKIPTFYFKIESQDQVNIFNKMQDSLEYLKARHHLEYLLHYAEIELVNMDKDKVDLILKSIKRFDNIRTIKFSNCTIQELPDSLEKFKSLDAIHFIECDSLRNLGKFDPLVPIFELYFFGCHIPSLPTGIENIHPMVRLLIHLPDTLRSFDLGKELKKISTRNNLIDLAIRGREISKFPESIFTLTALRSLMFESKKTIRYPYEFDKLVNLSKLTLTCWDEEVENSSRKNPNFINYYPIEYGESELLYMIDRRYKNMSIIIKDKDPYTYYDPRTIFYRPDEVKDTTLNYTYFMGENMLEVTIDYKEKKMYVILSDMVPKSKVFKVSLLNSKRKEPIEGVRKENTIIIDLEKSDGFDYGVKVTIGRYSKVFNFS